MNVRELKRLQRNQILPILQALFAAVLFGASAPLSKLLLDDLRPVPLAGLLYLGSGLGAVLFKAARSSIRKVRRQRGEAEAQLSRADLPWLAGAVLAGGVIGPILLLVGLRQTQAVTTSLLLNFETVATAVIAAVIFREAIGARIWWAMGFITVASAILTWDAGGQWGISLGALAVLGATLLWGIDNNLTRVVSAKDPMAIVMVKGLVAGTFSLSLSIFLGYSFPGLEMILLAMLVGSLCYGASIGLFVLALRNLGAARTGTLFATAPFAGAILSLLFLRESLTAQLLLSLPLMVAGTWFMLSENHSHEHSHDAFEHEHYHQHVDPHHRHDQVHDRLAPTLVEEHSHWHRHKDISHSHAHAPDIHHRHEH